MGRVSGQGGAPGKGRRKPSGVCVRGGVLISDPVKRTGTREKVSREGGEEKERERERKGGEESKRGREGGKRRGGGREEDK